MKVNYIGPGRELTEYSLKEAYNMSGVYDSDSAFEKDCKLMHWIGKRKHRCIQFNAVSYSAELEQAAADGIEVLIIKENTDVTES